MFIFISIIYVIAFLPNDVNQTFALGDFVGKVSVYLFAILPALLLLLSFVRKKGGHKK